MSTNTIFATMLCCMDGRCQEKALAFVKANTGVDAVDTITGPGMDGILANAQNGKYTPEQVVSARELVQAMVDVSVSGHGSHTCYIFGHLGCAGNPVELDLHTKHLIMAREIVQSWKRFDFVKIAMFDENWDIHEIA